MKSVNKELEYGGPDYMVSERSGVAGMTYAKTTKNRCCCSNRTKEHKSEEEEEKEKRRVRRRSRRGWGS